MLYFCIAFMVTLQQKKKKKHWYHNKVSQYLSIKKQRKEKKKCINDITARLLENVDFSKHMAISQIFIILAFVHCMEPSLWEVIFIL